MDGWSVGLLAVAGYVAVTALVRLMIRHRNQVVAEVQRQLRSARGRKQTGQARRPQPEQPKKAA